MKTAPLMKELNKQIFKFNINSRPSGVWLWSIASVYK